MNLGGDEAEMGLEARAFLNNASKNPFVTGWLGHSTMFFFLQSLFMRVFGSTITGLRILSALLGALAIPATYFLVRELHGRRLAFATATLLAAYAFHIHYSRLGLNNIADPLWATLVFFLIIRAVRKQQQGYYIAAGLALGFSMYFYIGARLVWVMLAVFLAFWMIQDFRTLWSQRGNFVLMSIAVLLILLPLIAWFINHPETFPGRYSSMGIIPSGWLMQTAQKTGQSPLVIILERTQRAFLLFNAYPETFGFYAPRQPLLDTISAVLFVFGLAFSLYKSKDRAYFLFVMWFVLAMFFGSVMIVDEAGTARLTTATVPAMFFVALGLAKMIEVGKQILTLPPRWCLRMVVVGVAVIALINLKFYFVDYVPMRLNSGDGGWMFTDMSRLFRTETPPFKAYFFGAPHAYIGHGTIRYMAPNLNGMDVRQPIHAPPDFVDRSHRAVFIFHPARIGEFEFVRQAYPDGKRIDYKKPNGQAIFLVYEVDKP
jgi:uncharacterized membrane protein